MEKIKHEERIKSFEVLITNNSDDFGSDAFILPGRFKHERHCIINNDQDEYISDFIHKYILFSDQLLNG